MAKSITSTLPWTPDAANAIELSNGWAQTVIAAIPSRIFIFGSVIYRGGDQFDPQLSDLDLLIVFNDAPGAIDRVERLKALRELKADLELRLIPALQRTNCVDPAVSLVPITPLELAANIHKSGARRFLDKNIYLELPGETLSLGLSNSGTSTLPDETRQALEYVQGFRNKFLNLSANGTASVLAFNGHDPLPKALSRAAAQLVPNVEVGEWYDTVIGLDHLWDELSKRRSHSNTFETLHRKISIRRGGRGKRQPLDDVDQLLLAEILYDLAAASPLQPIVTWEIYFRGGVGADVDHAGVLGSLRHLAPEGQIISVAVGSLIVCVRSSQDTYNVIKRLSDTGTLPKFFGVKSVELTLLPEEGQLNARAPIMEFVASVVGRWKPPSVANMKETETHLASWLERNLNGPDTAQAFTIAREVKIDELESSRADFVVTLRDSKNRRESSVVVDLIFLRSRETFFFRLDHALRFSLPTILVLMGNRKLTDGLKQDIDRLSRVNPQVKVVTVVVNAN